MRGGLSTRHVLQDPSYFLRMQRPSVCLVISMTMFASKPGVDVAAQLIYSSGKIQTTLNTFCSCRLPLTCMYVDLCAQIIETIQNYGLFVVSVFRCPDPSTFRRSASRSEKSFRCDVVFRRFLWFVSEK